MTIGLTPVDDTAFRSRHSRRFKHSRCFPHGERVVFFPFRNLRNFAEIFGIIRHRAEVCRSLRNIR